MQKIITLGLFLFCCLFASGQDYLKEANTCFDRGDYECAKKNYILFQTLDGRNMDVQIKNADDCFKAQIAADDYFKEKEYTKAKERYRTILEINPKDQYARKQYDECEKLLKPKKEINNEVYESPAVSPPLRQENIYSRKAEQQPENKSSSPPVSSSKNNYKKNVFGLDLGIGARKVDEWGTFVDLGIRYTYNFSQYFGWDIFNLKFQSLILGSEFIDDSLLQAMTGLKVYTQNSTKNIKGYASFKAGYGYQPYLEASGIGYELEIGLYFSRTFFIGFVYNNQNLDGNENGHELNINSTYEGLRIGFDF